MNILVCVKMVPDTSEAELRLNESKKDILTNGLNFVINESDNYAVEEAIRTKELHGGEVTVLNIGTKDADVMIRMALAKGAERAVRIEDPRINKRNPLQIAKVLAAAAGDTPYDLIFTGCMSGDDKNMSVGTALATLLGLNHAALVKHIEVAQDKVTVQRELEGGLLEVSEISLPAVLSVQTGINTPRYAPIREMRKALQKELKVVTLDELGLDAAVVNQETSKAELLGLYFPEVISRAIMLEGSADETAGEIAFKLVKGGLLA